MANAQVPWGLEALQGKVTTAAWRTKPASYLVANEDRMIPPRAQRAMASRGGAMAKEIESSHAVMLSHPEQVAAFIESVQSR